MALRRFDLEAGGTDFSFAPETEDKIVFWLGKYPSEKKRSAVIPLLWLAQKDNAGWLSEPAMRAVADRLEMPYIRVYEVATFYTMFRLRPVGRHHIQLCGTTPCMLRGAHDLKEVCRDRIGEPFAITDDARLSWEEVECLGACVNAPMVQINDYYYEDLTPERFASVLDQLRNGVDVAPGTFVDRQRSAPLGGSTSLLDAGLFDGSRLAQAHLPNLSEPVTDTAQPAAPARTTLIDVQPGPPPERVETASERVDDLRKIKGIGPKAVTQLQALGIYQFAQIAAWSPADVSRIEAALSGAGRVGREDWIAQARLLVQANKEA